MMHLNTWCSKWHVKPVIAMVKKIITLLLWYSRSNIVLRWIRHFAVNLHNIIIIVLTKLILTAVSNTKKNKIIQVTQKKLFQSDTVCHIRLGSVFKIYKVTTMRLNKNQWDNSQLFIYHDALNITVSVCKTYTQWAIKEVQTNFCPYLRQILTDFKNYFTSALRGKFATVVIKYATKQ